MEIEQFFPGILRTVAGAPARYREEAGQPC